MSFTIMGDNPPVRVQELVDIQDTTWMDQGACVGHDPDWWFHSTSEQAASTAVQICATCPVRDVCLEWADAHPSLAAYGIWGGKTETERKDARANDGHYAPRMCVHCRKPLPITAKPNQTTHEECRRARDRALQKARWQERKARQRARADGTELPRSCELCNGPIEKERDYRARYCFSCANAKRALWKHGPKYVRKPPPTCVRCGDTMPDDTPRQQLYCRICKAIRDREYKSEYNAKRRARRHAKRAKETR